MGKQPEAGDSEAPKSETPSQNDLLNQVAWLTEQCRTLRSELTQTRMELDLHRAMAAATAEGRNTPPIPVELLHALHSAGSTGVWVGDALALVAGSYDSDEASERAIYRHLLRTGDASERAVVVGYAAEAMPTRLLGYAQDDGIVVNRSLGRQDRGRVRRELVAKVAARHQTARPAQRRIGMFTPAATALALGVLLSLLRSLSKVVREQAVSTVAAVGPALATTTAAATFVAAVATSQLPAVFSPSGNSGGERQSATATVADALPVRPAPEATPRRGTPPSATPHASSSPPIPIAAAPVPPTAAPSPPPTASDTPTPAPTVSDTPTPALTASGTPVPEPAASDTPAPAPTASDAPAQEHIAPGSAPSPTPEQTPTEAPPTNPGPTQQPAPPVLGTNEPPLIIPLVAVLPPDPPAGAAPFGYFGIPALPRPFGVPAAWSRRRR